MKHIFFKKELTRYLLNYLIIFCFIVIACCPFIWQTYHFSKSTAVQQATTRLQEGVNNLCKTIDNLYTSSLVLRKDSNVRALSSLKGVLPTEEYVYMNYVKEQVLNLYMMNNNLSVCLMLFPDNDIYISNEQVSASLDEYYDKFIGCSEYSSGEFRNLIFSQERLISFLPLKDFFYYESGKKCVQTNPLFCLLRVNSMERVDDLRFVIAFAFIPEQLAEWMLPEEIRDTSYLRISDLDGTALFSYGNPEYASDSAKSVQQIHAEDSKYGLQMSVFYPKAAISSPLEDSVKILAVYTMIGLLLAVILIIFFSVRQYQPLKTLIAAAARESLSPTGTTNEYEFISGVLTSVITSKNEYKERLEQIESTLQYGTVEKLMLRGIETEAERAKLESFLKVPIRSFCVASVVITDTSREYSSDALDIERFLTEHLPFHILCVPSSFQELIFLLLPQGEDALCPDKIYSAFSDMAAYLTESAGTMTNIGLSTVREDIHNLNICYNQAVQARRAYAGELQNTIGVYDSKPNHLLASCLNLDALQRIRTYLLGAERTMLARQFEQLMSSSRDSSSPIALHQQQIYYFFRHLIWCTLEELSISDTQPLVPAYQPSWSFTEMIAALKASCFRLCDRIDEQKRSRNSKLKNDIILFLNTEYTRCDLTASIVCQRLGISEKYLFQFLKEQTGKTFSSYLEELRMAKAEELLLKNCYSNVQIAEASGFGSVNTLYRAFNRYRGMPPAAYKKLMLEKEKNF